VQKKYLSKSNCWYQNITSIKS